jgi:hypothetical protein
VAGTAGKPLFSRVEVTAWLAQHARNTNNEAVRPDSDESSGMDLWAALNRLRESLRAEELIGLVLSLAVARKTGATARLDELPPYTDEKAVALVKDALERIDAADLASAVEFTLQRVAKAQGRYGGGAEYGFVGSRTSALLANLAASRPGGVLYDPACGAAVALIEAVQQSACPERIVGHDVNSWALQTAGNRAVLHDVDLELRQTDVLREDVDPDLRADVVLLEPPFGLRLDDSLGLLLDPRFCFGLPPRSSADTLWLQHAIAHLTDTGRAYVLTPGGPLLRGAAEGRVRSELVRNGCVEAVVALPGKLHPHMSIPLALWVLRRPVPDAADRSVLFIDAGEAASPETDVPTWLADSAARQSVPHAEVGIADVLAADAVLAPVRWIQHDEPDPRNITETYTQGWAEINDAMTKLQNLVKSFKHFAAFSTSRVLTVRELVEQGVLDVRQGRPKDRYEDAPEELRERIVEASDISKGTLHEVGVDDEHLLHPDATRMGDVLVITMNKVRARVDEAGGHLPANGVYRIRIRDREVLSPWYLAAVLTGSWNERFQSGSTIQRASIKDLEIPLIPKAEQLDHTLVVSSIRLIHDEAARLGREADKAGAALLDAIRYNAPLIDPDASAEQPVHEDPDSSNGSVA